MEEGKRGGTDPNLFSLPLAREEGGYPTRLVDPSTSSNNRRRLHPNQVRPPVNALNVQIEGNRSHAIDKITQYHVPPD